MVEPKSKIKKIPRKPYKKPEIVHEIDLETRAGSPPGPLGPFPDDSGDITSPDEDL
jgi:hypothetical protein